MSYIISKYSFVALLVYLHLILILLYLLSVFYSLNHQFYIRDSFESLLKVGAFQEFQRNAKDVKFNDLCSILITVRKGKYILQFN